MAIIIGIYGTQASGTTRDKAAGMAENVVPGTHRVLYQEPFADVNFEVLVELKRGENQLFLGHILPTADPLDLTGFPITVPALMEGETEPLATIIFSAMKFQ